MIIINVGSQENYNDAENDDSHYDEDNDNDDDYDHDYDDVDDDDYYNRITKLIMILL